MSQAKFNTIVRHLRAMAVPRAMKEMSDGQLLQRYLATKDEAAFTTIVQRHGRLVWTVCRNVLRHDEDAEDALQASFLVLATKGSSIKKAESLASWLHGVAFRTAMMAKRSATVRRGHENEMQAMAEETRKGVLPHMADSQAAWKELLGVLDAEVRRLPEKYAAPFVLCCLEGRSGPEAARLLGWKQGTVDCRLSKARKLLGQRLIRRGIDLSLVLGGLAVSYRVTPAAGLVRVAVNVLQETDLMAAGQAAGGAVTAHSVELAVGVMKAMTLAKVKLGAALLVMVLLVTSGVGLAAWKTVGNVASAPGKGKPPVTKSTVELRGIPRQAKGQQPAVDADGNPLPENALARLGSLAFYDGRPIQHVAVSPDGALLTTIGFRSRLWDAKSGRELPMPGDALKSAGRELPFFTNDRLVAVDLRFKDAIVRDLKTNKELARFAVVGPNNRLIGRECFALSPDGNTLVLQTSEAGLDRTIRFCDVGTGKLGEAIDLKGKEDYLIFAFSGDGKTLIIVGRDSVLIWDLATQTQRGAIPMSSVPGVSHAAISFDGKLLATAFPEEKEYRVRLWETKTLTELAPLQAQPQKKENRPGRVMGLAFSPDRKALAVSYNGSSVVRLWDMASRKEIRQYQADDSYVQEVVFFPDGKTLAGVGRASVTLWDLATAKRRDVGHACGISSLAFSADGKTLITGAGYFDASMRLWDPVSGRQTGEWPGHTSGIQDLTFSPDGKLVASFSQDKSICIREFRTGKVLQQLQVTSRWTNALLFTSDGKSLYTGGREEGVHVWDVATGKQLGDLEFLANQSVERLAFTSDGKTLATFSFKDGVRLWDARIQKLVREFGNAIEQMLCFTFSPDGKFLCTAGQDSKIRIRETATGRIVRVLTEPPPQKYTNPAVFDSVAYSPDGRTLAVGQDDGTVRLWDLATWQERAKFDGHRSSVVRLVFSSDGTMLASGAADRTAMVWDISGKTTQTKVQTKTLSTIWEALGSADAGVGYGAIKAMLAAGPTAVSFLNQRLAPAAAADEKLVDVLITDLGSDQFAQREKALRQLKQLGDSAEYALQVVLAGEPSLELRRRAEGLLELLELTRSPDRLRALRAVEVLEHIGTPDAQTVLQRLANGGSRVRLTQEAKASVLRLTKR